MQPEPTVEPQPTVQPEPTVQPQPTAQPELALVGSWRLRAWTLRDGRGLTYPYGPDATGLLVYAADGRMSASVCTAARPALPGRKPRDASAPQLAEAYLTFFTYSGRWHIDGADVLHDVELALNPNMVGTVQRRRMTFTPTGDVPRSAPGTRLDLTAEEDAGRGVREHVLSWERV